MDQRPGPRGAVPGNGRRGGLPYPMLLVLATIAILGERLGRVRLSILGAVALAAIVVVTLGGVLSARAVNAPPGPVGSAVEPVATATSATDALTPSSASAAVPPTMLATATIPPVQAAATPTTAQPTTSPVTATVVPVSPSAVVPTPTATAKPVTPRGPTVIPILMYHYIRTVTDPTDTIGINLSVKPELFARQMRYLADNGYTTLTMSDVYAILAGQQPLPPKPIALTFDDGYRDFYTSAWPVLRQYNFKATSYVVSGFVDGEPYMTWAMLKELDASGQVEIGVHSQSHGDLSAQSQARRWQEIAGSKATIEQGIGHRVTAFCYPAGKYDAGVIELVRKAGYLTATTVKFGSKQSLNWAYELPRVRVNGPDSLDAWIGKLP